MLVVHFRFTFYMLICTSFMYFKEKTPFLHSTEVLSCSHSYFARNTHFHVLLNSNCSSFQGIRNPYLEYLYTLELKGHNCTTHRTDPVQIRSQVVTFLFVMQWLVYILLKESIESWAKTGRTSPPRTILIQMEFSYQHSGLGHCL